MFLTKKHAKRWNLLTIVSKKKLSFATKRRRRSRGSLHERHWLLKLADKPLAEFCNFWGCVAVRVSVA